MKRDLGISSSFKWSVGLEGDEPATWSVKGGLAPMHPTQRGSGLLLCPEAYPSTVMSGGCNGDSLPH